MLSSQASSRTRGAMILGIAAISIYLLSETTRAAYLGELRARIAGEVFISLIFVVIFHTLITWVKHYASHLYSGDKAGLRSLESVRRSVLVAMGLFWLALLTYTGSFVWFAISGGPDIGSAALTSGQVFKILASLLILWGLWKLLFQIIPGIKQLENLQTGGESP